MLARYRWFTIRFPRPLTETFAHLDAYRQADSQARSFVTDVASSSFEFFWRTPMYATSIDDDGQEQRSEFFSTNRQKAQIVGESKLLLRLENPPRSSKEMLNCLEDIVGFGFVCQPVMVTESIVLQAISEFSPVLLTSIKMSGGIPDIVAIGRVELASKVGLNKEHLDSFGLQGVTVESASYSVRHKGLGGQVGFSRTGICKISGELAPLLISRVERSILASSNRG
ncbi:hypothetical protein [Pseudomonas syringae]|uniref:hypothetical protein n=2 Tax=Pseudomonas syringae TaxID=317 RepID=UPI000B13641A|nr:hypothetical protein [Pseudomonas syringae]PBP60563.1 hypothetical protein CCL18_08015 [Pseudomonas syringae]